MRTVPFQSVLNAILLRLKIDPRSAVETMDHLRVINAINTEVREAWEHQPWPEWTPTEERWYRPWWNSATAYNVGDEVWDETGEAYYRCSAANTGLEPSANSADWWPITQPQGCPPEEWTPPWPPFDRYISLDQISGATGDPLTPIGTVIRMTRENPDIRQGTRELEYYFSVNGVQVSEEAGNSVWVQFRMRPPTFTYAPWLSTLAYAAGALVYDPAAGDCFVAAQGSTGEATSNAAYWTKVNFPYVLAEVVKRKVLADLKVDEEKLQVAAVHESEGELALSDEWDKVEGQQGQERRFTVNVRGGQGRRGW